MWGLTCRLNRRGLESGFVVLVIIAPLCFLFSSLFMEQSAPDQSAEHGSQQGDEDWDEQRASMAAVPRPKEKAKPKAASGKSKAKAKATAKSQGKREPVTRCICPNCPFPKYQGSRFCSLGDHKKAWDNMVYQRRTRKNITEEERKAFDEAMKDDGFAGKSVERFALDSPPEMKKKGLVDFTQFIRVIGQRVAQRDAAGDVPMTEKAFYKHCENVLGLSDQEAADYWREYEDDPRIERDQKGFRGSLRLWLPMQEYKVKEREHYVDNQVVEGSDVMKAPSEENRRIFKDGCS